jgi:hypothetical protein
MYTNKYMYIHIYVVVCMSIYLHVYTHVLLYYHLMIAFHGRDLESRGDICCMDPPWDRPVHHYHWVSLLGWGGYIYVGMLYVYLCMHLFIDVCTSVCVHIHIDI